jgi:formate dehydrogenase major subunit
MGITRRGFLQVTGAAFLSSMAFEFSNQSEAMAVTTSDEFKLVNTEEYPNICCYCSGGCGTLCSVRDGVLINIEGDPDHPVNRGALCSKGSSQFSTHTIINDVTDETQPNPNRLTAPKVRRAGATDWEDISWDQAMQEIGERVKKTRDESYITVEDGVTVNRTEAIASLGAAMLDNEEAYLVQKLMRSLGVVYIDHQARV